MSIKKEKKRKSKINIESNDADKNEGNSNSQSLLEGSIENEISKSESSPKKHKKKRKHTDNDTLNEPTDVHENDTQLTQENVNNQTVLEGSIEDETFKSDSPKKHKKKRKNTDNDTNISKKSKVESVKEVNGVEDPENSDENEEKQEKSIEKKPRSNFSIENFKKKLHSSDGIDAVKEFVEQCGANISQDFALDYINSGGNIVEILHLLDTQDKKNLSLATPVFEAVNILLLKIQSNAIQNAQNAIEGCRYLLNNYIITIHSGLSPFSTLKQKRITLKLLTSIVTLSPLLAKEILLQLNFTEQILENLTQQNDGTSSNSVRTAFIHFLLSFLIDGNSSNIRNLLEKKGVVGSIFEELIYDDYQLVNLVLTTLQKNVLESSGITKTSKLYTFSSPVLKNIVNLYNWKGRKYWKTKIRKKSNSTENFVDENEKNIVVEVLHNFLIVLCTSRKHGIIFHDKTYGTSGQRFNNLIYTMLECLDRPWEHKYVSELVIKITCACPDLYSFIIGSVDNYLEPRASIKWLNVIMFVKGIITSIKNNILIEDLKDLNSKQLVQLIQNLFTPNVILKVFSQTKIISHGDPYIREINIDFLLTVLKNLNEFINSIQNIISDIKSFKTSLYENLIKILPSVTDLLKIWSIPDNKVVYKQSQIIFGKYLNDFNIKIGIIELLELYYQIFPRSLDDLSGEFTPEQILTESVEVILKASDLFLKLDSNAFTPDKEYFLSYLNVLLKNFNSDSLQVLNKILIQTGIFENNKHEINYWLEFCENYNAGNLLGTGVRHAYKDLIEYTEQINLIKNHINFESGTEIDDIFDVIQYSLNTNIQTVKHIVVTPLILAVLDLIDKNDEYMFTKSDWKYLSCVLINIFHAQTLPEILIQILSKYNLNKKYCKQVLNYINSWNSIPIQLDFDNENFTLINYLNQSLLSEEINLKFDENNKDQFKISTLEMCIFYFTQLVQKKLLKFEQVGSFVEITQEIFEILHEKSNENDLLKIIYNNPFIRSYFIPFNYRKNSNIKFTTEFLLKLTENLLKKQFNLNEFLKSYHEKFVTSILLAMKKYRKYLDKIENFNYLIQIFQLNNSECLQILQNLVLLPEDAFVVNNTPSVFYHLLIYCIKINSDKIELNTILTKDHFRSIIKIYMSLKDVNIELLTENLLIYLQKYPHFFDVLTIEFFETLLNKTPITKNDSKLIAFCVESSEIFFDYIRKNFDKIIKNKEIILPLVNIKEFEKIQTIYDEYEYLILKTIEKPHKAGVFTRENSNTLIKLIIECMPIEKAEQIALKVNKYEIVEEFHLDLLEKVYMKCIEKENSKIIHNYLQTLIILAINCFKRNDLFKIKLIFMKIQNFFFKYKKIIGNLNEIYSNSTWSSFMKFCLKHGIKHDGQIIYLQTLRIFFQNMFHPKDSGNEGKLQTIETIYEMIQMHSEFLDVMLDTKNYKLKIELLKLILILTKYNRKIINPQLIPILLGAYNCTLNESDQLILAILYLYERNSINFDKYKPFLWGDLAITHYSVRHNIETAIWRQPRMQNVLELIQMDVVYNTIMNFDWKRSFGALDDGDIVKINDINLYEDRYTEIKHRKRLHRLRNPGVGEDFENNVQIYDLNFFLPLFSQLLSSESFVKCYLFTQHGCLALTLLSLASECPLVRQAGYNVLARFYFHLESSINTRNSKLWIEFINRIRYGLVKLQEETKQKDTDTYRIPVICAVFLARSAIIMNQPLNPLYMAINNFIFVKSAIDFTIIPEFLQMFHSPEIEYNTHRNWILQVIRDGFKTNLDFQIMRKSMAYKMIFDFYSCIFATDETKLLILQILEKSTQISYVTKYLLFDIGILSWMNNILHNFHKTDTEQINLILKIINNIYLLINEFENSSMLQEQLLYMLITISTSLLTSKMSIDVFLLFVRLLLSISKNNFQRIREEQVQKIINFSNCLFDNTDCNYLMLYGCKYVSKNSISNDVSSEDDKDLAKYYLKQFTINWLEANK